jgi:hypothetical protein
MPHPQTYAYSVMYGAASRLLPSSRVIDFFHERHFGDISATGRCGLSGQCFFVLTMTMIAGFITRPLPPPSKQSLETTQDDLTFVS